MQRRAFVVVSMSSAGALVLGLSHCRAEGAAASLVPGPFVRVDPDDWVTVTCARAEMGQGSRTALAMLVAEELDADWTRVRVQQGDLDPVYGEQFAGGSAVVRTSWEPLRQAGAAARAMLLQAAAASWGVTAAECQTQAGRVMHPPSSRSARYGELTSAAAALPVPQGVPLKPSQNFRIIGTRRQNLDHPAIVSGQIRFGMDHRVPGMLFAVVERAPVFGGSVRKLSADGARGVAGVREIIVIDADRIPDFGENNPRPANGVAVLADSTWAALQGRKALSVEWDDRGGADESTENVRQRCVGLSRQPDSFSRERGSSIATGLAGAVKRLEAVYETQLLSHAPMEPMNCLADVRPDRCEIWAPSQMPEYVRVAAEKITGLPASSIVVHVTRMGGAFGRRFYADYAAEAIYLSKAVGRPVQVVWTREDDLGHGFYRPAGYHLLRGGVDRDGGIAAWEHRLFNASRGHYLGWAPPPGRPLNPGEVSVDDYPVALAPAFRFGYSPVESRIPRGQWRAVENSANVFVTQSFIDELAHLAGRDPLEFRLHLYHRATDKLDPGSGYDPARLLAVLRLAAERAEWDKPMPVGQGRGIAACYANTSYVAHVVEVSVAAGTVKVNRVVAAVDAGLVVDPNGAQAQVEGSVIQGLSAALGEEITVSGGRVNQQNFDDYPLLRLPQVPTLEVHFVPQGDVPGGLGEPALPPLAPALTNAIFAASGIRIRRLPVRRELRVT